VRVTKAFERRDGTDALPGEPLIKFGLLSLVDVGDPFLDEAIMDWFGLERTADGWTYDHGKPTEIMTLAEVAELAKEPGKGREPDFFELLKAVILDGSLGQTPGAFGNAGTVENPKPSANRAGPVGAGFDGYSSYTDMQILRIGANIIDQYDADSYPTAIYIDLPFPETGIATVDTMMKTAYGIENLPTLYRLVNYHFNETPELHLMPSTGAERPGMPPLSGTRTLLYRTTRQASQPSSASIPMGIPSCGWVIGYGASLGER